MDINQILEKAPSLIAERTEQKNKFYALMKSKKREYKQLRARKYLEIKAREDLSIAEINYMLDDDTELCALQNEEFNAEIEYKNWALLQEKAEDWFESAKEQGYNQRAELRSLEDTIKKDK